MKDGPLYGRKLGNDGLKGLVCQVPGLLVGVERARTVLTEKVAAVGDLDEHTARKMGTPRAPLLAIRQVVGLGKVLTSLSVRDRIRFRQACHCAPWLSRRSLLPRALISSFTL